MPKQDKPARGGYDPKQELVTLTIPRAGPMYVMGHEEAGNLAKQLLMSSAMVVPQPTEIEGTVEPVGGES